MTSPRFILVDVFGEEKYSGNQLAVFVDGFLLSDIEMQKLAREINFSETTFITSHEPQEGGYDVRIFTPRQEIDFAGHPVLGTAFVIRDELIQEPVESVTLNLKVGQIPVAFPRSEQEKDILWMDQAEPSFGNRIEPERLVEVLNLPLTAFDARFPVQEVSTGLPHIIVPLKDLASLRQTKIEKTAYMKLVENGWAKCILCFCPEGRSDNHSMSVRMFADYYGIPEDPATGSGNGCLAGYLVHQRYFGSSEIDLATGQGHEIGRPSVLHLRARKINGKIHVSVGGRVIPIAQGHLMP